MIARPENVVCKHIFEIVNIFSFFFEFESYVEQTNFHSEKKIISSTFSSAFEKLKTLVVYHTIPNDNFVCA